MTLSEKLKRLRFKYGLSQSALAEKAGLAAMTISNIETGAKYANMYTISRICEAFDITLAELFINVDIE